MNTILEINILTDSITNELCWRILITCIATIIVNLPFGYWRGGLKKLSFWWFFAIHLPVPAVILIRKFHELDLTWSLVPFLFGSFFLGQFLGKKIFLLKPYKKMDL